MPFSINWEIISTLLEAGPKNMTQQILQIENSSLVFIPQDPNGVQNSSISISYSPRKNNRCHKEALGNNSIV